MPIQLALVNRRVLLLALLAVALATAALVAAAALSPDHADAAWLCYHNRWRC